MFTNRAASIRRSALLVALGIMLGFSVTGGTALANHLFPDVPPGSPFHDDVDWLVDQGIATGFPDGTFRGTDPVNRQQASRWFRNYAGRTQVKTSTINPGPSATFSQFVTCPAGTEPVGGGGGTDLNTIFLTASYPSGQNWAVQFRTANGAAADPSQVTVSVICGPSA